MIDQPVVFVKPFNWVNTYMDGGTKHFFGWDGKSYYEDHRIGSNTEGQIYDRYPASAGATILDVNLVEVNERPTK